MIDVKSILPAFRNKLKFIAEDERETPAERLAASFYLRVLEPYNHRILIRQHGFACGVGGSGDNIVGMPAVERDETGAPIIQNGQLQITSCMFDDFQAYLSHIERRKPVDHNTSLWMSLPSSVNAIPRDDYMAIWDRHMGWSRD